MTVAAGEMPAQDVPIKVNISMTATFQSDDASPANNTGVTRHNTKTVRLTSQILLSLISTNLGTNFSKGSSLALLGDSVVVIDLQGNQTDVSAFLAADTSGTSVVSGQENSATGAASETTTQYIALHFDDGSGNSFLIDGLVKETRSASASDTNHHQKVTASISGNLAGYGSVGGSEAVFSGSVSGNGKGTVTAP